ncbi:MAG: hypothetical protein NC177_12780 [Ruminococcus flavefaciens]|nr:hypothetical protein [Ruminococcus flavefaciens]
MAKKYNEDADGKITFNLNNNNSPQKTPKGNKTIGLLTAIIVIIIVIAVFILFLNSGKNEKPTDKFSEYETSYVKSNNDNNSYVNIEESATMLNDTINFLEIDSIVNSAIAIDRIEILGISDKIQSEDEQMTYEFTSFEAGTYRFELSDITNNALFTMTLYNADMEQLAWENNRSDGKGITYDLNSNSEYFIVVEQQNGTGSYNLNVGCSKGVTDVSEYTEIGDSIQYTDQKNKYLFTSSEAGTYRFELSDITNNALFTMALYNADMEQLAWENNRSDGAGITCELNENTQYFVVVEHQGNNGSYKLNIGCQKPVTDISYYNEISDSIQYTNQKNKYLFIPSETGEFEFKLSDVTNDALFTMALYNADMEQLIYENNRRNDSSIYFDLEAGKQYFLMIIQQGNFGKYNLSYSVCKE